MSLFTSTGKDVQKEIQKEKVDLKSAYIRLKGENESIPVRVMGTSDCVGYKAHSDFKKGLYNTPCLTVQGDFCPYCHITKNGGEEWEQFYAKDRYLFAFADLSSGIPRVLEVSKNQAKKLMAQIDEYAEEIENGEVAFNLTRSGTGTSTMYVLNMMTAKKMSVVQDKFDAFDDLVIDIKFFEDRLPSKSPSYMLNLLEDAGADLDSLFEEDLVAEARAEKERVLGNQEGKADGKSDVKPLEDSDDDEVIF